MPQCERQMPAKFGGPFTAAALVAAIFRELAIAHRSAIPTAGASRHVAEEWD